jgi:TonB-dependent receptor
MMTGTAMKTVAEKLTTPLAIAIAAVLAAWQLPTLAQAAENSESGVPAPVQPYYADDDELDEVVVSGRFISSSEQLVNERMNNAFVTDLLGADAISRLGDSTVAAALRRVPGLTLVQDKFVYIRGLGERYSQTTLNGAYIPSPDLTRNVIPLNVFPTSVVESLRVQKSWSPELSANFGGGAVDIRTTGIPDEFTFKIEAGLGVNNENPGKVATYPGGGNDNWGTDDGYRALSPAISEAMATYRGNPNVNSIFGILSAQDPGATFFDAQTINRELALALNRDAKVQETSANPDYDFRASIGNKHSFGSDWEFGYSVGGTYETETRWRRAYTAAFSEPEEQNGVREETRRSVNLSGTLNLGLAFGEDHKIETTTLFLRNTDDETEIHDFFNENTRKSQGSGNRDYRFEFEERNMITNQIKGTHYLGAETRDMMGGLARMIGWLPEETKIEWFYSDSTARTDIPNRVLVQSGTSTDVETGEVLSESVFLQTNASTHRYTELDDDVNNYGVKGLVPLDLGKSYVELSGGYDHAQKARTYRQTEFSLGFSSGTDPSILTGPLDEVFSDENIMARVPDNPLTAVDESLNYLYNVQFDSRGASARSYLAATMTDSAWGQVDWTWNDTWRVAAGARWENYRQATVPWNPYGFSADNPQVSLPTDPDELEARKDEWAFSSDEIYPSVGITYMGSWWAETFQLRLGYSQTAVRPDLREITASSYADPITGDLTIGNPGVTPADVDNIDLRAEWFFSSGDNLSVTLFSKDITNPIEFLEIGASDTTIAREIKNLESATVKGVEFEGLKELGFLGGVFDTLFLQGNVTIQDSELEPGATLESELSCIDSESKNSCRLSGASEYVVNLMLGFDSRDRKHTASLIYNVFGERVFAFGRLGPDAIEQPFDSLDFTYFWYPTDRITFKAKVQNILSSTVRIEQSEPGRSVVVFEEDPGTNFGLSLSWQF